MCTSKVGDCQRIYRTGTGRLTALVGWSLPRRQVVVQVQDDHPVSEEPWTPGESTRCVLSEADRQNISLKSLA